MEALALPHQHDEDKITLDFLQKEVKKNTGFEVTASVFKQLGDPTRLKIFWLLCHCEECVLNLAAMLDMSSPAVSHHLRPLKAAKLIVSRREGKEVYYKAADTEQTQLLHHMMEKVMQITCCK